MKLLSLIVFGAYAVGKVNATLPVLVRLFINELLRLYHSHNDFEYELGSSLIC